jgi:uncharacterized membrane protein
MMEALANAGIAWFAYRALERWPGIVLVILAMVALIVLLRKHRDPTAWRFTARRVYDLTVLAMIAACMVAGLYLLVRDEAVCPKPPVGFWQCLTR